MRKTIAQFLKFHTRAAQICGFSREFVKLRVAQFVMKIAHLAISMERRGPLACGLLPWLWLLVVAYGRGSRTIIEAQRVFSGKRSESMYFFDVNLMHAICKLRYVYFHVVTSEKCILVCYYETIIAQTALFAVLNLIWLWFVCTYCIYFSRISYLRILYTVFLDFLFLSILVFHLYLIN